MSTKHLQQLDEIEAQLRPALPANLPDTQEAKKSLIAFTEHTFPRFEAAAHHRLIAEKLEAVERGDIDRLMIFAPPRHTKSELASRRFPAWYLGKHPDRQIICASYSDSLAVDFGRDVRDIISREEYQEIFDTKIRPDSRAAERFQTVQGGIYTAAGVGSGITGRGAHVALVDDPIKNREEAESETYRKRVWDWFRDVLYTRLMPGGAIIVIQTRWHEDDLAGRLVESQAAGGDEWEVLSLPAMAKENDALGREPGSALWPAWYPIENLERIRSALTVTDGPSSWESLYQCSPQPEEGDFFRADWVRWYDSPPEHLTYYGASDYAVTSRGGDYTVHGVIGVDPQDNIYLVDWWREQASTDIWVESVISLMDKWQPSMWAEEKGQIEKSVGPFLHKRMRERSVYCRREQFASATDKATRARAIQGRLSMGCVFFPRGEAWANDIVSEMLRFPNGTHDDQVDVLSLFGRMLEEMSGPYVPSPERKVGFQGDDIIHSLTSLVNGRSSRYG
jgi:predicted phage terminase large subunit-like protein